MTREETKRILALLQSLYGNVKSRYTGENAEAAWYLTCRGHSYETVRDTVLNYMQTKPHPPEAADIGFMLPKTAAKSSGRGSCTRADYLRMLWYLLYGGKGGNEAFELWAQTYPDEYATLEERYRANYKPLGGAE